MGEHDFRHFGDAVGMSQEVAEGFCHIFGRFGFAEYIAAIWDDFSHIWVADEARHAAGFGFD